MSGLRVLVVDPDEALAQQLGDALVQDGFEFEAVHSGASGLEAASADIPDLVLCEVELPDMSGWQFIRQLRAGPQFAFVPVLFLSEIADETVRVRGFRLGADDVLAKPVDVADLALRVARVLADSYRIEHAVRSASEEASATPASATGSSGMRGTLADVGLSTLMSIFEVEKVGGVLTVTNSDTGQIGRIYLRGGRTVRARYQGMEHPKNREVIYGMLRWSAGHFAFRSAYIAGENEVDANTMHLLIEGARRLDDESRIIRRPAPDPDLTPAGPEEEPEPISAEEAAAMLEAGRHGRRRSSVRVQKRNTPDPNEDASHEVDLDDAIDAAGAADAVDAVDGADDGADLDE